MLNNLNHTMFNTAQASRPTASTFVSSNNIDTPIFSDPAGVTVTLANSAAPPTTDDDRNSARTLADGAGMGGVSTPANQNKLFQERVENMIKSMFPTEKVENLETGEMEDVSFSYSKYIDMILNRSYEELVAPLINGDGSTCGHKKSVCKGWRVGGPQALMAALKFLLVKLTCVKIIKVKGKGNISMTSIVVTGYNDFGLFFEEQVYPLLVKVVKGAKTHLKIDILIPMMVEFVKALGSSFNLMKVWDLEAKEEAKKEGAVKEGTMSQKQLGLIAECFAMIINNAMAYDLDNTYSINDCKILADYLFWIAGKMKSMMENAKATKKASKASKAPKDPNAPEKPKSKKPKAPVDPNAPISEARKTASKNMTNYHEEGRKAKALVPVLQATLKALEGKVERLMGRLEAKGIKVTRSIAGSLYGSGKNGAPVQVQATMVAPEALSAALNAVAQERAAEVSEAQVHEAITNALDADDRLNQAEQNGENEVEAAEEAEKAIENAASVIVAMSRQNSKNGGKPADEEEEDAGVGSSSGRRLTMTHNAERDEEDDDDEEDEEEENESEDDEEAPMTAEEYAERMRQFYPESAAAPVVAAPETAAPEEMEEDEDDAALRARVEAAKKTAQEAREAAKKAAEAAAAEDSDDEPLAMKGRKGKNASKGKGKRNVRDEGKGKKNKKARK